PLVVISPPYLCIPLAGTPALVRSYPTRRSSDLQRARLLFLLRLHLFEETYKCLWIVSCLLHVLQPEIIGFRFEVAREFHEGHRQDRKSTRLSSSHQIMSYPVFCLPCKGDVHTC